MRTPEGLTTAQEAFAQGVADGLTQSDAYRKAYPNSRKWADKGVWEKASLLRKHAKVAQRIDSLREKLQEKTMWRREDSVNSLRAVIEAPDHKSDVVSAVKELNSMHGYKAPDKSEVTATFNVNIRFVQ